VLYIKGKIRADSVQEQGAELGIWTYEEVKEAGENHTMRNLNNLYSSQNTVMAIKSERDG